MHTRKLKTSYISVSVIREYSIVYVDTLAPSIYGSIVLMLFNSPHDCKSLYRTSKQYRHSMHRIKGCWIVITCTKVKRKGGG